VSRVRREIEERARLVRREVEFATHRFYRFPHRARDGNCFVTPAAFNAGRM
jgi:hypothetical protein